MRGEVDRLSPGAALPPPPTRCGPAGLTDAARARSRRRRQAGNWGLGLPVGVLGGFLALQTSRVKFVFAEEDLEVVIGDAPTEDQPENAFVGGENKWTFDSFVNWEFWWPDFPVLVYFKETQTKPEGQVRPRAPGGPPGD